MAAYIAQRIMEGAYTYEYVVERRPDLQDIINIFLTSHKRQDLIKSLA
ncbi:hypothetical protein H8B09_02675 [Paenibacillus sp. PR3]|uniref:Uncharacterized protein n=1 Tax=Paenibacillus terricola TaxID=2763503 RepID=A0ABR8MNQ7_9BACL|nr:hypothetical protein [Paenibacillus terricola]MBD3917642.1 hypothetical protein [Paenibacillus terricola]